MVGPGSASVIGAFTAFTTKAADDLRLTDLPALGSFGVASYDPAHIANLANPAPQWRLAMLPVQMAPESSPMRCARIPGWRAAQRLYVGDVGPGVCLGAFVDATNDLQDASCESLRSLNSYGGPLNGVEWGFDPSRPR